MSATSGTDTDVIFWTRGGIPSGLISLPNRYMHSPVELICLGDLKQIPELMAGFALSLKKRRAVQSEDLAGAAAVRIHQLFSETELTKENCSPHPSTAHRSPVLAKFLDEAKNRAIGNAW